MSEASVRKVKGAPTKELFVHILTRDIAHHAAITELVDNSVDGAKRIAEDRSNLSDYAINIEFDEDRFTIVDNCGGIPLDVATDYAFRFGRPEGAAQLSGSIGQFGVGMKRALFSFGRRYLVESATKDDWFRLEVDLGAWMQRPDSDWDFELESYGRNDGTKPVGTRIEVTELTKEASTQFALAAFRIRVENEIRQKHRFFIAHGLVVQVCGTTIPSEEWQLFADDVFKPAYLEKPYDFDGRKPVVARIYTGVGRSSPSDAGWYVICNGRLILYAEKSEKTGWGWNEPDEGSADTIPRYHNQFARFRGYALFDSDDAGRLPWNTTKTDVDSDDPIWLDARDIMASMMRPVIDFLNVVDKENDLPDNERVLTSALQSARPKPIADVDKAGSFMYERREARPRLQMINIQFRKEKQKVVDLQTEMGTSSARETGDAAFEECYKKYVLGG